MPNCRVLILGPRDDYRRLDRGPRRRRERLLDEGGAARGADPCRQGIAGGETLIPSRMLGPLLTNLLRRKKDQDRAHDRIARLTRREREVLALLADGADNDDIGRALVISPQTARTHVQNILGKLSVHSRLEAAAFVTQNGDLARTGHGRRVIRPGEPNGPTVRGTVVAVCDPR